MVTGPDSLREMRVEEHAAVDDLLRAAFGGPQEAGLVRSLRKSGDIRSEMVLGWKSGFVGYFALSRMVAPDGWLCLASVAVDPDWQRKGRGQLMMGLLSEWAITAGVYVVVLGQVAFYESGGFSQSRAARLTSPYPIKNTLLAGPNQDVPETMLKYPKAFDGL